MQIVIRAHQYGAIKIDFNHLPVAFIRLLLKVDVKIHSTEGC